MKKVRKVLVVILTMTFILLPSSHAQAVSVYYNLSASGNSAAAYTNGPGYVTVTISASFYKHLYPDMRYYDADGAGSSSGVATAAVVAPQNYICYSATSNHSWDNGSA